MDLIYTLGIRLNVRTLERNTRNTSFHASIQQVAQKMLHEVSEGVEGDIGDLISAYHYCTNTIVKELEGELRNDIKELARLADKLGYVLVKKEG